MIGLVVFLLWIVGSVGATAPFEFQVHIRVEQDCVGLIMRASTIRMDKIFDLLQHIRECIQVDIIQGMGEKMQVFDQAADKVRNPDQCVKMSIDRNHVHWCHV